MARTDLRISDDTLKKIKERAKKNNRSLNGELLQLIDQGLLLDIIYRLPNGQIIEKLPNQATKPAKQEVKEPTPAYNANNVVDIPHFTGLAAGPPIEMNESVTTESVPKHFIEGKIEKYYTLKVRGNSMSDMGITNGCHILVRATEGEMPKNGGVYIMRLGSKATVKKLTIEFSESGQMLYYQEWCDGSGMRKLIEDEDWAVLGEFVRVV